MSGGYLSGGYLSGGICPRIVFGLSTSTEHFPLIMNSLFQSKVS